MPLVVRCPECRKKFSWKSGTDLPSECPLCEAKVGSDRADDDIVMPFLRSRKTDVADKVYRDMEKGSEHRMHLAAEVGGGSASDYAGLKITNLNDRNDAEISAMQVRNAVTDFMEKTGVGGFTGGQGVGYSGAVQTGPYPNAGARMRTSIQQHHATLSHGAAVSDTPALETQQPGYRRRG